MARGLLTDFELMILLAVLRVDHAYGVEIAREIEQTGRRAVMLPAVYAALERLERNGMIRSAVGEPTAERGGRAKRFFTVTPQGIDSVKETRRSLTALWTGITELKEKRS